MNIGKTGAFGEDSVVKYLKKQKYKIVERNFVSRFGEIDIIAKNKEFLAFVEVKTRKENNLVSGVSAVDSIKQQKIILTAEYYLSQNETALQPRFDVAEVTYAQNSKNFEINYIENAF